MGGCPTGRPGRRRAPGPAPTRRRDRDRRPAAVGRGPDLPLERGRRTPQPEFLDAADELLGARGPSKHLLHLGGLRSTTIQVLPLACEDHAGGGPFVLLAPEGRPQVAYVEVQSVSRLVTDPEEVRILSARYGSIRGQALSSRESPALVEKTLGER